MADLTYDVQVNVSDATRNLDRLNTRVSNVTKAFGALRNALAGVALGSFIANTLRWADAISDLSDATGIAVENIQGFSSAVVASGGNVEGAQKAILQLVQSIGEAADGSSKVQYAFEQVGVSLKDLATLSEQQILQKTIDGLAKISDRAKQARLSNELLGKSLRGVELNALAQAYPSATAAAAENSTAIKAAAGAQQALERNLENLRVALVNVLEPLNKIVAGINISAKAFEYLLIAVAAGTAAFLYYTRALTPLISLLRGFGNILLAIVANPMKLFQSGMGLLSRAFYAIAGPLKTFGKALKEIWSVGKNVFGIFQKLGMSWAAFIGIIGPLLARLAGIAGIVYTLAQAFAFLDETLNEGRAVKWIINQWDRLTSIVKEYYYRAKQALGLGGAPTSAPRNPQPQGGPNTRRYPGQNEFVAGEADRIREVRDRNEQLRISIIAITEAYKNKNAELLKSLQLDLGYLKLTEDEAESMRMFNQVMDDAQREIDGLIQKRKEYAQNPEQQALIPTIDAQIAAIRRRAVEDATAAAAAVRNITEYRRAQEQLRRDLDITALASGYRVQLDQLEAQQQSIGLIGRTLAQKNIQLEIEAELQNRLLDIETRRAQVMANLSTLGQDRVNQELANLNAEESAARAYADRRTKIEKSRLEKEEILRNDASAGARAAFQEFVEQIPTEYQKAYDTVNTLFDGMLNALDTFVRTGKFKFRDFAMSIIRDLIMIQVRAAMSNFFAVLGNVLKLAFLAGGGPAIAGKPYIVGEKGPELFVPKASGTVVPNNQLAGGGAVGGMMAAPVTNNYITNNISAIDAKGVAQVFAENRRALLGTVRFAQKEQSYRTGTY